MHSRTSKIIRVIVTATGACATAAAVIAFTNVPPKIHGWILGLLAVMFGISELAFRSLISEFNFMLRRGGYSLWQIEQLQQVIPKLRTQVLDLWTLSLWLKGAVGVAAALLQWTDFPSKAREYTIFSSYAVLFVAFAVSCWAQRNYRRMEQWCDQIAVKEVEVKEDKRLKNELKGGSLHDFSSDTSLGSYTKPAQPI